MVVNEDIQMRVELEEGRTTWSGGETLRGLLHVQAERELACDGLIVRVGWKTGGRGNEMEMGVARIAVHDGTLPAGPSSPAANLSWCCERRRR